MVEIFNDAVTDEELKWFKNDMNIQLDSDECSEIPFNPEESLKLYGLEQTVLDRRYVFKTHEERYELIKKIFFNSVKSIPEDTEIYAAYQRQYLPHLLHIDALYPNTKVEVAKSVVLPLENNPNDIFKTIVFDVNLYVEQDRLNFFMTKDNWEKSEINDFSNLDLDHCKQELRLLNTLNLSGIYTYKLGSFGMFNRYNLHCSSNWRKYKVADYKDFIIMHLG